MRKVPTCKHKYRITRVKLWRLMSSRQTRKRKDCINLIRDKLIINGIHTILSYGISTNIQPVPLHDAFTNLWTDSWSWSIFFAASSSFLANSEFLASPSAWAFLASSAACLSESSKAWTVAEIYSGPNSIHKSNVLAIINVLKIVLS
jgi:hypothetical protein